MGCLQPRGGGIWSQSSISESYLLLTNGRKMEVYSLQGTIATGQEAVGMRYFGENRVAVGKMFFTVRTVNHEKLACWSDGVTFEDMACQGPGSSPLRPCVLQKMGPVISRGPWQRGHVLQGCAPVCQQIWSGGLNHKCIISSLTPRVLSLPFCQVQGHRVQQTFSEPLELTQLQKEMLLPFYSYFSYSWIWVVPLWVRWGNSTKLKKDLLNK